MTPISLETAFQTARDRVLKITELAMPELVKVNAYADTEQPTTPYAEVLTIGVTNTAASQGKQDINLALEVRVWCGQALEGYDGELQNKIFFSWLPSITQHFIEYSNLCYRDADTGVVTERVPYMDTERSGFQNAKVILAGDDWLLSLNWQLMFTTGFKKVIGF